MEKYKHGEQVHNLKDPSIIVPEIMKLLNPKSVVDFGCGLGTFLCAFKKNGVVDVLGLDGAWVNKALLYKYINPDEFVETNLEKEIKFNKKYDLVVSLEVAEHLSADSADIFVKNLVNSGNTILFSAAVPNQGGQNHINEQWLTYWEEKFLKYGFIIYDVIRPIFWNYSEIFPWYKQNMVLLAPKGLKFNLDVISVPDSMRNIIHYDLFNLKTADVSVLKSRNLYIIEKEAELESKNVYIIEKEAELESKNVYIREREQYIDSLEEKINRIKKTRSYKTFVKIEFFLRRI